MPDIEQREFSPDVTVVAVSGQIVLGRECQRVEWTIEALIREGKRRVILDLANLTHIDSTGVGIIVTACGKMAAAEGELRLAALQPRIAEVLRIAKLDRILALYPSVDAAAERFPAGRQQRA
jgi:anti-sigma B factor antagonist